MALAPPRSLCALGLAPRTMRVTWIPARGVMVPLFLEEVWRGESQPPFGEAAGGLAVQARPASEWFKKSKEKKNT